MGLRNRSPPLRSLYRLSTLSKAVAACNATVMPQATEVSVPTCGQRQLTTLPVVEPFPHSFILGAEPGHSSPSLENSTAGGWDDKICAWLRPSVPRTHSVCGQPQGLNYFCSTGGQIPKTPGNRARVSWVGLVTSLGEEGPGKSTGLEGKPEPPASLLPTLPSFSKTSRGRGPGF